MDLPADSGADLPGGILILRSADRGSDRVAWDSAGWPLPGGALSGLRGAELLDAPRRLLAGARRRVSARRLHRWRGDFRSAVLWLSGTGRAGASLHPVPLALYRRPGFHVVPVGHAAAGNRLSGHLPGLVQSCGAIVPLAAVPADVSIRRGEIA